MEMVPVLCPYAVTLCAVFQVLMPWGPGLVSLTLVLSYILTVKQGLTSFLSVMGRVSSYYTNSYTPL